MSYKDKDRQKEAQRERTRRYRDKQKGVTSEGVTQGVTSHTEKVKELLRAKGYPRLDVKFDKTVALEAGQSRQALIEHNHPSARPDIANYGEADCECMYCKSNRANGGKHIINHGPYKPFHLLGRDEFNRVTLPGDIDFQGVSSGA